MDYIDYVVNSHPDNDHAGGLAYVLENMSVGELWMHRPWIHSAEIRDYFHDGRITDNSLAERLQDKMSAAYALEEIAEKKEIPINEPFADCQIGIFKVLSPLRSRYIHELIPEFEKSPEQNKSNVVVEGLESFNDTLKSLAASFADKWNFEYLPETVKTSAENESSAILFAKINEKGFCLQEMLELNLCVRQQSLRKAQVLIYLKKYLSFRSSPRRAPQRINRNTRFNCRKTIIKSRRKCDPFGLCFRR